MKKCLNKLLYLVLFCSIVLTTLLFSCVTVCAAEPYSAYVMGYFKETPKGSDNNPYLHLAVSTDGCNWTPLNQNNAVLKPTMGTKCLRDPFFLRKKDGTFIIVATDNWNSEYIHVWSSTDLRTFTNERLIRMNTTGMHSWAPEVFYDASKGQYAIIWSGNTDRNRIYVSYTTDFVTVTSPQVFFDPGFSVIDGHMELDINGYNYMYYKSEKDAKIYGTRSTSLNPGSFNSNTYTTGYNPPISGSHIEAPIIVRSFDAKSYWLWGDSYIPVNALLYAWKTNDISTSSWKALSKRDYEVAPNAKHATIAAITATEYNNLIEKWGKPEWTRIKSYNYPYRYIRHSNNVARIDEAPFDPTADMQWKLVPGLADQNAVSFQSVNNPNYYLRHSNSSVVLNQNDNSDLFKQDATFYKTEGFADSSWTSFRSYNFPDKYIRQSNYVLRIDTISTGSSAADKEDATFRIAYSEVMTPAKNLVGDLNGDASVDVTDYALMKKYILGAITDFPVQNDLTAGDLNSDGVIDALDFAVFKKYLLGTISKLPYSL